MDLCVGLGPGKGIGYLWSQQSCPPPGPDLPLPCLPRTPPGAKKCGSWNLWSSFFFFSLRHREIMCCLRSVTRVEFEGDVPQGATARGGAIFLQTHFKNSKK